MGLVRTVSVVGNDFCFLPGNSESISWALTKILDPTIPGSFEPNPRVTNLSSAIQSCTSARPWTITEISTSSLHLRQVRCFDKDWCRHRPSIFRTTTRYQCRYFLDELLLWGGGGHMRTVKVLLTLGWTSLAPDKRIPVQNQKKTETLTLGSYRCLHIFASLKIDTLFR